MLDAQLATHYVASERLADLEERIRGMGERAGDLVQLQRLVDEYQVIVEQSVRSAIMTVQLWHLWYMLVIVFLHVVLVYLSQ